MKRQNSFSEVVHDLMDAWIASAEGADAGDIYEVISKSIRPNLVLAVIDTSAEDAMDFVIDFVHRYEVATDVQGVSELQTRRMFRDFRDQEFLRQHLIPACEEVLQQQRPVFSRVLTAVAGLRIAYERLLLPQKCRNGRSSWCISFADVKFLLPPCPKRPNFDDADLSILQLLREGFSVKEIGIRIELSHRTVEHRIERLKSKMSARSLPHLVALSIAAEL